MPRSVQNDTREAMTANETLVALTGQAFPG